MPDALLRGTLAERPDGTANRLGLPVLPDRWVVLRLLLPRGREPSRSSPAGCSRPTGPWPCRSPTGPRARRRRGRHRRRREPLAPDELTGTVGGSVVLGRRVRRGAQPLRLPRPARPTSATLAPDGVDRGRRRLSSSPAGGATPADDPLDAARSTDSLHELLDRLRWRLLYEWGDAKWELEQGKAEFELRKALGLTTEERWSSPRPPNVPASAARAAGRRRRRSRAMDKTFVHAADRPPPRRSSPRPSAASSAAPWHLRSSLLHGVGVRRAGGGRRRSSTGGPTATGVRVALGRHDDDVLAALSSAPGTADGQAARRRAAARAPSRRRRSTGSARPTGWSSSRSTSTAPPSRRCRGGSAGTDRFLQRVQTGGVGGRKHRPQASTPRGQATALQDNAVAARPARCATPRPRRPASTRPSRCSGPSASRTWSSATELHDPRDRPLARRRRARDRSSRASSIARRPASRSPTTRWSPFAAPARSLRHGNDGRGSADGKLTCRWPTHVITEISGDHRQGPLHPLARQRQRPDRGADARPRGAAPRPVPRRLDRRRRQPGRRHAARPCCAACRPRRCCASASTARTTARRRRCCRVSRRRRAGGAARRAPPP